MNFFPKALSSASLDAAPGLAPVVKAERSQGRLHAVPASPLAAPPLTPTEVAYRGVEVMVAATGLLFCLPLILLAAAVIRLDSPGPALFLHRRPARSTLVRGRDLVNRTDLQPPPGGYQPDAFYYVPSYFTLVKLRTMYHDSRNRFANFYTYDFQPEEFHRKYPTLRHDPRVTRAGRILRKLSVDELPNLWSVLTGDLRLVGPRPEAPEVLRYYTPEEMYKFSCKPGITGLAQISGRGLLDWGETLACDLEYVRTRSVALDLKIIFVTIKNLVSRHGAF
jgi:lipopolysaccharide/colanic/teichoic acid biosynthesis glycosyltransferase